VILDAARKGILPRKEAGSGAPTVVNSAHERRFSPVGREGEYARQVRLSGPGTRLAMSALMLRRALVATAVAAAAAGALTAGSGRAEAAGAWLSSAALTPTEQRVALAVGPTRTTLWTSLRFDAAGGSVALIVPAPPGSSLDFSSDAWFEALEVATAPRLFPPAGADPFCPGKSGSPNIFQLDGQVSHTASLAVEEVTVLDDPSAVSGWAAQAGFTVSTAIQDELTKLGAVRFVAVRFNAPAGPGVTPTLRVAMPSAPSMLPLALTHAAGDDLRVTAWMIGAGRADLIGGTEVTVSPSVIAWKAKDGETDYDAQRSSVLGADPARFLVESSSHEALGQTMSIAGGTASIESVVTTFFERAAAYGDGDFNASLCIAFADNALVSSLPVAASCPRALLGVVPPAATCTESPGAGQTDPAKLRCGAGADDLAVALSGFKPTDAWVTRQSLVIAASGQGTDWFVDFTGGPSVSRVIVAGSVDAGGCADGGAPAGASSSSSSSSSGGHFTSSSSGTTFAGTGGHTTGAGNGAGGSDGTGAAVADAACSCAGAGTQAAADSCASDTSSSSGCDSSSSSDSCSGSSSSTESCSSNSGSDSCSGSSSSEACSGSSSSEACSGSSGGSSCSGGDFGKCSTSGGSRVRAPKFSILALAAFALLAPLRRRGRTSRRKARAKR
jgi:hypothetical protein